MNEFVELSPEEKTRTYTFPNGSVSVNDVKRISVSDSGTHRLETSDGKKHIIPTGWLHIELDVDSWTF